MLGLTVQNFVSAASGMAVLAAVIRGFVRRSSGVIGNFWADVTRSTLYILLPLSLVLAAALISQGVVQTFAPYVRADLIDSGGAAPVPAAEGAGVAHDHDAAPVPGTVGVAVGEAVPPPTASSSRSGASVDQPSRPQRTIALGPVASQIAIKQLGTNGGGFFNVNSAHPFENPTPISNFLELLAILLIPAALCCTFGRMVGDMRQGGALLAAMGVILIGMLALCVWAEQAGNPTLARLGLDQNASDLQSGGNMEGKEVRFGIANSALWATATTAASNGSVNAMHDAFTPLGGLVPMLMMQLGEVIYGGVGSGLYGMLLFVIVAVFISGLMVGRTPEYLGKKIEAHEMKMASLGILVPPFVVVVGTAAACVTAAGLEGLGNPGVHGFSEILYAFSSAGNNNGSAFAGLTVTNHFYEIALGIAMLFARYWVAIPALAIAGSLARKKAVPAGPGTLPTHTPLFVLLLIGTILLVGALAFFPALALGPIVEHLEMKGL
jgi:K+-transporting ATPase ATPase A chain